MGCCGSTDNNGEDLPFGKLEEFTMLKTEINEIITNKHNKRRKNANVIFELYNKTSNKITEYEKEIKKLKNKKYKNKEISDDMIKGLTNDIQELKEYTHTLNDLLKETDDNDKENDNRNGNRLFEIRNDTDDDFINEEVNMSNGKGYDSNKKLSNKNNLEHFLKHDYQNGYNNGFHQDFKNETENDFDFNNNEIIQTQNELENDLNKNNVNDIQNQNIYFKKYIRRNKKSEILNKKNPNELFGSPNEEKENNFNENEELIDKNEDIPMNDENPMDNENNLINMVFALDNDEKINLQIGKNEKLLDAVIKLGEMMEDYNDIEKLEIYDGNDDITDKVKNGEIMSAFDFNDFHIIQLKLKN